MKIVTQCTCNRSRSAIADEAAIDPNDREHDLTCCCHEGFTGRIGFGNCERPLLNLDAVRLGHVKYDRARNPPQNPMIRGSCDKVALRCHDPCI